jgi:hypothetical protein
MKFGPLHERRARFAQNGLARVQADAGRIVVDSHD